MAASSGASRAIRASSDASMSAPMAAASFTATRSKGIERNCALRENDVGGAQRPPVGGHQEDDMKIAALTAAACFALSAAASAAQDTAPAAPDTSNPATSNQVCIR